MNSPDLRPWWRRELPLVACWTAVVAWAIGPVFIAKMSASMPTIVMWRQLMWLPVLWSLARTFGDGFTRHHFAVAWKPGIFFSMSAITGFWSYDHTTIANATLLSSLTPAVLLFVAPRILGEKVTVSRVMYSLVAFVGVAGVVFGAELSEAPGNALFGDGLALTNMVMWTIYFIAAKKARDEGINTWSFLTGVCLINCIVSTSLATIASDDVWQLTRTDWLLLVAMTVIPGTIGHYLITWSARYLDATVSSLITLAGPVLSTALAFAFLGQNVAVAQMIGGVVVLLGLGGVIMSARPRVPNVPAS
jgi:drug/metabolite transporter (DMT)-like permease